MIKKLRHLILICGLMSSVCAFAQGRATVYGTVTDPTGAVVPGAQILLTNTGTKQESRATSNASGDYTIPSVTPGEYNITITAPGFQTYVGNKIDLQVDENRNLSPKLAVGSTSERVEVNVATNTVDTRSSTITEVIDSQRVLELPLDGRNPLDLQTLVAGAGNAIVGGAGQAEENIIAINGNRQNNNNYTLDGADNEDPFFNSPSVVPNPDALDQFSIQTSNYTAVEGRNSGAVINAIIKSGTNSFHGSVFEYLRNSAIDTWPYFKSPTLPPYKRNQFGGSIGGPILRDRMFFFGSYQGTRQAASPNSLTSVVPSATERTGDFREYCDTYTAAGICNATTGNHTQLYFPGTTTKAPFNDLTAYLYAPSANFVKAFVPLPNASGNKLIYTPAALIVEDQYITRIDTNLGTHDTLSGHLVYVNNRNTQEPNNVNLPGFMAQINYTNYHVAVNETHVFSPTAVNVATFGYNRINRHQFPIAPTKDSWQSLGSGIIRANPSAQVGWQTNVPGYFGAQTRWPLNQLRMAFQYADHLIWNIGNHNVTLGGDMRTEFTDQSQTFQSDASVSYAASQTKNALSDFMVGRPTQVAQQSGNGGEPSRLTPDLYVNDSWRVASRLTLDLGVRWEPFRPLHDRLGRVSQLRPGQQSTVFPTAPVGYVFPGDAGVPTDSYHGKWSVWGPRVGIAYDVFGNGKTSLRAAVGIYNANIRSESPNDVSTNPPYALRVVISNPPGGLAAPYQNLGYTPFPYTPPSQSEYSSYKFPALMSLNDFSPDLRQGRATQWNLNIQQQLPARIVTTIAYVGSNGEHLLLRGQANPSAFGLTGSVDSRRIHQGFSSITRVYSDGHSQYHSLQATANRRMSKGLSMRANYTWSKSIDNGSYDQNQYPDPFDHSFSRGLSDFDIRHVFSFSSLWTLPGPAKQNGLLYAVAGGWSMQAIVHLKTGTPFSILSGVDNSKSGVNSDSADVVGPIKYYRSAPKSQWTTQGALGYFDKTAFAQNALGTFGNAERNLMTGPGTQRIDFSLEKRFSVTEHARFVLRGEAFNMLNHTNFANPGGNLNAAGTFGRITTAADPRILQVAGRIEF